MRAIGYALLAVGVALMAPGLVAAIAGVKLLDATERRA